MCPLFRCKIRMADDPLSHTVKIASRKRVGNTHPEKKDKDIGRSFCSLVFVQRSWTGLRPPAGGLRRFWKKTNQKKSAIQKLVPINITELKHIARQCQREEANRTWGFLFYRRIGSSCRPLPSHFVTSPPLKGRGKSPLSVGIIGVRYRLKESDPSRYIGTTDVEISDTITWSYKHSGTQTYSSPVPERRGEPDLGIFVFGYWFGYCNELIGGENRGESGAWNIPAKMAGTSEISGEIITQKGVIMSTKSGQNQDQKCIKTIKIWFYKQYPENGGD